VSISNLHGSGISLLCQRLFDSPISRYRTKMQLRRKLTMETVKNNLETTDQPARRTPVKRKRQLPCIRVYQCFAVSLGVRTKHRLHCICKSRLVLERTLAKDIYQISTGKIDLTAWGSRVVNVHSFAKATTSGSVVQGLLLAFDSLSTSRRGSNRSLRH